MFSTASGPRQRRQASFGRRSTFRPVLSPSSRQRFVAGLARDPTAAFERALLAGGFLVLFLCLPHSLVGDDLVRFDDIERLLHDGGLSDSRYSLVMPILSAPFLLLGEVVGSPEWWAERFNVLVVTAGAIVAARSLRGRIDAGLYRRLLLVLLFASLLTNRLRDYNAEVLTATLFAVGIVLVVGRRHSVAGWTALVVGVVNTPAALVPLALVGGAESVRSRRLRCLLPAAAAVVLIAIEAWIRRGGPLVSGYEDDHGVATILPYSGKPGFSYPFLLGVAAILFSFGRGLVFFAPGLLLWLSGRTRREAAAHRRVTVLMLLAVAGLVLVYAKWWAWYGGLSWGPRFFVFAAVPASLLLALRLRHAGESAAADAVTLGVLALSAWVGVTGAVADLSNLAFCARDDYAFESLCWYSPEYSSLWQPIRDRPPVTWTSALTAGYCLLVFVYLAWPLVRSLGRALAAAVDRSWIQGWRL
jgi:hypothetical protein